MRENSGPNGAGIRTYYTYDAGGRLEGVESGSESGVASPIQHRTFDYDGRGFLKRECHPEKGYLNSGNTGCVQYGAFDAQGNPASRTDGPFTLAYAYDAIGRLTQVSEANAGLLKEFFYAPADEGSDLRAGKLVQAKRHNYVDGTDYVVTETYGYEGPEGRVSSRRTTVRDVSGESAGSQWFEQSFTYDSAGNLTTSGAGTGTFDALNMMTSLSGPGRNERYLDTPHGERIATIRRLAASSQPQPSPSTRSRNQ